MKFKAPAPPVRNAAFACASAAEPGDITYHAAFCCARDGSEAETNGVPAKAAFKTGILALRDLACGDDAIGRSPLPLLIT